MRVGPRLRIEPRPVARTRRRPMDAIEALAQSETDFRQAVAELESAPLFRKLVDVGAIRRRTLRGRIPAEAYRAYLDLDVLPLIRRTGVADSPRWLEEFARAWPAGVRGLARKHRISEADAGRIGRYAKRVLEDRDDERSAAPSEAIEEFSAASVGVPERTQSVIASFVERFGLDERQLRDLVLDDAVPVEDAARTLGAPVSALIEARDAASALLFASEPSASSPETAAGRRAPSVVGRVVVEGGVPRVCLDADDVYSVVYGLGPEFPELVERLAASREEAESLLRRIRQVNDRKSMLQRVLAAIVAAQSAYFAGAGLAALKPLSQAEVARRVGEHPSTVSRLLRDKAIETDAGQIRLKDLFVSRGSVIGRLAEENPEASDRRLAELLRERYGISLSRRAIGYHRVKSARREGVTE